MRPPFLGPVREQCFGFPSLPGIRMLRPSLSLALPACSSDLNDVMGPGSAHLSPSTESLTKLGRAFARYAESSARGFGATERSALYTIGSLDGATEPLARVRFFILFFFLLFPVLPTEQLAPTFVVMGTDCGTKGHALSRG